ncbi:MAG: hypothetical protein KJO07_01425 [Deltaproteobacteria bacterium]|nr:hypothetical protein [Deltaproteobacteria bacterium]
MVARALLVAALLASLGTAPGCSARGALTGLRVAAAVTEVIVVASILAHHDAHYHDLRCGHRYRYYDGRYNYWYGGHWEYHDDGRWYAY